MILRKNLLNATEVVSVLDSQTTYRQGTIHSSDVELACCPVFDFFYKIVYNSISHTHFF